MSIDQLRPINIHTIRISVMTAQSIDSQSIRLWRGRRLHSRRWLDDLMLPPSRRNIDLADGASSLGQLTLWACHPDIAIWSVFLLGRRTSNRVT